MTFTTRTLRRPGRPGGDLRCSGYPALDRETIATVRRAQPFPPPPADLPGATFEFTLPVEFAR
jgi:TonB family protein